MSLLPHSLKTSLGDTWPCLFQSVYFQLNHHKRHSQITRSKVSYSLIEPQPLPWTPACGYQFHVLAVHPSPNFTSLLFGSAFGIQFEVYDGSLHYGNSQCVKPVHCFSRGAPSLIFDEFLNVTRCEEVSATGVTQGNFELPLPPDSLELHHTQRQQDEILYWLHVLISFKENSSTG